MKEVEKWIEKAKKDLEDAKFNFEGKRFEVSSFLSHQAAEKALKALYILKFKRLWKIHDLEKLCLTLKAPQKIIKTSRELNPHYIETRYPIESLYDEQIAKIALENSEKVLEWVKEELKRSKKR
jgi:HEPN domain-containing protein